MFVAFVLAVGFGLGAIAPDLPRPTNAQLEWHDAELGMFLHFAPNTWTDKEGDDLTTPLSTINPKQLDTDQWARVAKSMGAKYLVFVAKHEGGFCWWPSQTTTYSVSHIPWRNGKGDVMADLSKSCQKYGLKLGVYLSPRDAFLKAGIGGKAEKATDQAEYEQKFKLQLTELLSNYGPIFEVWFDGSLVFDVSDILAKYAPHAIVFQGPQASIRWVGNEEGFAPYPAWNGAKFKKDKWGTLTAADGDPAGNRWLPNETDCRIRDTWFWKTYNQNKLKSVNQLMLMYEGSVGHGAVMLLNNTPDTTGLIPAADAKRSAEFGAEIRKAYGLPIMQSSGRGPLLTMQPSAPVLANTVVTMEDIRGGERVRAYTIEGRVDGDWIELASGTAIGHKKIDLFNPAQISEVRLKITSSVGEPIIRAIRLHYVPPRFEQ